MTNGNDFGLKIIPICLALGTFFLILNGQGNSNTKLIYTLIIASVILVVFLLEILKNKIDIRRNQIYIGLIIIIIALISFYFYDTTHTVSINITDPVPNQHVSSTYEVKGICSNASSLYLVIKSPNGIYHVQNKINVNSNGNWNGEVHLGTIEDSNKSFTIYALVTSEKLKTGIYGDKLPNYDFEDNITVIKM